MSSSIRNSTYIVHKRYVKITELGGPFWSYGTLIKTKARQNYRSAMAPSGAWCHIHHRAMAVLSFQILRDIDNYKFFETNRYYHIKWYGGPISKVTIFFNSYKPQKAHAINYNSNGLRIIYYKNQYFLLFFAETYAFYFLFLVTKLF